MTTKQLHALSRQLFKLRNKLEKSKDPTVAPYFQKLDAIWHETYSEVQQRENQDAQRRDNGAILFEVFAPGEYGFRGKRTIRTPHRLIQCSWYTSRDSVDFRSGAEDRFALDLHNAMGHHQAKAA